MTRFPLYSLLRLGALALVAALAFPAMARADDQPPPELAPKTSDALQKLQPLLDAKNWDGAIELLSGVAAMADPDSYDRALIYDTLGKLYAQKDDFTHAIESWESALRLVDSHSNYFQKKDMLELVLSLAQTYSQVGSASKDPAVQREDVSKATEYVKRWLSQTSKPTADIETFYASVLYSQATINEKSIDQGLLGQAQDAAMKAMHLSIHPKETLYELLYATYAQQSNLPQTAAYLEILAAEYPKKTYWSQLLNAYINLASDNEKDEEKSRDYYIRAILTMERAQAFGQMKTPKDYFNLFTMYYTAGQYGEATDLLYNGMKDGRIESSEKNWLQLAAALLQNNQNLKAIQVLKEASQLFPDAGEIDFQIAQIYSVQMDDSKTAYEYIIPAIEKGGLERPFNTYYFEAYLAYNLEKFPEGLKAAEKAQSFTQGADNKQLVTLIGLIKQSMAIANPPAPAAPATPAPAITQ